MTPYISSTNTKSHAIIHHKSFPDSKLLCDLKLLFINWISKNSNFTRMKTIQLPKIRSWIFHDKDRDLYPIDARVEVKLTQKVGL